MFSNKKKEKKAFYYTYKKMSISIYEIIHWLIFVFPFFPPSVKLDLPKKRQKKNNNRNKSIREKFISFNSPN